MKKRGYYRKTAIYEQMFRGYFVRLVSFTWICCIFEFILLIKGPNLYDIKLFSYMEIIFVLTVKIDFTKHIYLCNTHLAINKR